MKIPTLTAVALVSAVSIGATVAAAAPASASTMRAAPRAAASPRPLSSAPARTCGAPDGTGPVRAGPSLPYVVPTSRRTSGDPVGGGTLHVVSDETFSVSRVVSTRGGTTHVSFVATDLRSGKVLRLT